MVRKCLIIFCSLLVASFVATILMFAVYNIPTNKIKSNILSSYSIIDKEQSSNWAPRFASAKVEIFTDLWMFNMAGFEKGDNIREIAYRSMMNPYYRYENNSTNVTYDNLKKAYKYIGKPQEGYAEGEYSRYWHGYLIFLKPLLVFFDLSDLRMMNMVIQSVLLLLLLIELYKKGGYKLVCPFLVAVLIFNPISSALCIEYSYMYSIALISVLLMLKMDMYASSKCWLFFLWLGIVTSFFDFLSYPITALGCNLILLILLSSDNIKSKIIKIISSSISWGIGYFGMQGTKWLWGSLLTGHNLLKMAYYPAKYRMSGNLDGSAIKPDFWNTIERNIGVFDNHVSYAIILCGLIVMFVMYLSGKYKVEIRKELPILLGLIAMYPFVWMFVLQNHSLVHFWKVYKILMLPILSIVYTVVYSIKEKNSTEYQKWLTSPVYGISRKTFNSILICITVLIVALYLWLPNECLYCLY